MPYTVHQWPASIKKDEIDALPVAAATAVLVMLRVMRERGPRPEEYNVKPLSGRLHGLNQVNMKINKEQIRVLFSVYDKFQVVVFHVFKKTSPQIEQRGYDKALGRKRQAELFMARGQHDQLSTLH